LADKNNAENTEATTLMKISESILLARARLSIRLAIFWPSYSNISAMREYNRIILSAEQLKAISTAIKRKIPCNLLVFGLGNDSFFGQVSTEAELLSLLRIIKIGFKRSQRNQNALKLF
jgi:hypothetical protein